MFSYQPITIYNYNIGFKIAVCKLISKLILLSLVTYTQSVNMLEIVDIMYIIL